MSAEPSADKPLEVEATIVSETFTDPAASAKRAAETQAGEPKVSGTSVLGAAAGFLDAAAVIPEKLGQSEIAQKMHMGAAAARALGTDADRVLTQGRAVYTQAKDAVDSTRELLSKLPPMKIQDRSHLSRTRKKTPSP